MSNRGGTQTILLTAGREDLAAELYKEIKRIIRETVKLEFSLAIKKIAGVSAGTWYNYISNGKQKGKVSKYTVDNLSNYFNLPSAIFTCEKNFTDEHREIMKKVLLQKFQLTGERPVKQFLTPNELNVIKEVRRILENVDKSNNTYYLGRVVSLLKQYIKIANKRKEIVELQIDANSEDFDESGDAINDHPTE